ncbi:MAG: hypothetical protein O9284_18225 [Steroidobacteraceae bacterium]|jgi:hypothetical protein|nr:hypothetical protein [Steroidobacteraceae bacterium]
MRTNRRGQALAEYLVVTAVLAAALLTPWADGLSVMEHLLGALQRWYRHYALAIASS